MYLGDVVQSLIVVSYAQAFNARPHAEWIFEFRGLRQPLRKGLQKRLLRSLFGTFAQFLLYFKNICPASELIKCGSRVVQTFVNKTMET